MEKILRVDLLGVKYKALKFGKVIILNKYKIQSFNFKEEAQI